MTRSNTVSGTVAEGHGVASGQSTTSPYAGGSLRMQLPFFQAQNIPLDGYYLGTINVDIAPQSMELIGWDYEARQVAWTNLIPPEDFFFSHCQIKHCASLVDAMVYYPSPKTKMENFHHPNIVEILAPKVEGVKYGDPLTLLINPNHCQVN